MQDSTKCICMKDGGVLNDESGTTSTDQRKHHRSVSQLKKVSKCGEQFRIEKFSVPRPPARPAAWLALGVALHEAFVEWEFRDRSLGLAAVLHEFEMMYDDKIEELKEEQPDLSLWMLPPNTKSVHKSIDSYKRRGLEKDVPWYYNRCVNSKWEVAVVDGTKLLEVEFELEHEGVPIVGFVDRVQWWPSEGYYTIEDTKTGSADNDDWDSRQLKLYQIAIQEKYDIPIKFGRYWYTKLDRGSKWFDLDAIDSLTTLDQYATLDEMVGLNLLLANPGKHCLLCPVRELCPVMGQ